MVVMTATRVLLTGFEPFGSSRLNPSQEIVRRLGAEGVPGVELHAHVLPVEFAAAAEVITRLIDALQPQVVIALGQAEGRDRITPERVAVNLADARMPDNGGHAPSDAPVVEGGPSAYFSTLPVKAIVDELAAASLPAGLSMTAGTYVCNTVFYAVQHHVDGSTVRSGFIHVPLMTEQADEFPGLPTMALDDLVRGIAMAITTTTARVGSVS